ncbi:MAG: YqgE/AlgH family protein [Pirellulaceae bacterium]|jgi:putative transcriptional regulator|nr:YqgE/AlgH family protein [Pirellulaceae bacterium]MDP7015036.1 YqgE/AlgH family protein [Pirellulaceae bacterium]
MSTLQGQFLVASPHLPDVNFFRSVVLIIQHDDDGAFGVVLNRPTENTVGEFWEMISKEPCESTELVNHGGPVAGSVLALHTDHNCSETEVIPGVHVSTAHDNIEQIVQQRDKPYRIFCGYAGWSGGQLEHELEAGGWMTIKADLDEIFACEDDLWERAAQSIGLDILTPLVAPERIPADPTLN